MQSALHVIILAAGRGTRMCSDRPKVLHSVGGRPMLAHVLDAARALAVDRIHVVHGHGGEAVQAWARAQPGGDAISWCLQAEQLGTGHAVREALAQIPDDGHTLVLYGDVPLVEVESLRELVEASSDALGIVTAIAPKPHGYGRILRSESGAVRGVVEEADATSAQRAITEVNTGVLAAPTRLLRRWLAQVGNDNAKREYYLTDIVQLAVRDGVAVQTVRAASSEAFAGVNDRIQLARAERAWQAAQAEALMRAGVCLADPSRFDLRGRLQAGRDVFIDVDVLIEGEVRLGDGVHIGPFTVLRNVAIAAGTRIDAHSVLESATVGRDCRIGPFARIRPDTVLGDAVHVGNFVEIKKSQLADGVKANHLAYIGDAVVGAASNIGAGVITCNYDGASKHATTIGRDVFVGSDTQLIAPVAIGEGATIGAGSTITRDVPAGGLTIARAREQRTYPGWQRPRKPGC